MPIFPVYMAILAAALTTMSPAMAENCTAAAPKARTPPYGAGMTKLMERLPGMHAEVIFLGDSITAGWPKDLRDTVFPQGSINFGAGGDTTANLLWRIRKAIPDQAALQHAVLLIGTNDFRTQSPCQVIAGILAVVDKIAARAPTAMIHLLSILPRGPKLEQFQNEIEQVNYTLRQRLADDKVNVINVYNLFRERNAVGHIIYREDNLHLTRAGYEFLTESLSSELKKKR
jgi:platelet-activating factor acetylhydrolase IB subunit beta/gamma